MSSNPDLLGRYEADQQRRGLAATSIQRRRYGLAAFERHIAPRLLLDATKDDVEGWLDSRALVSRTRYWHLSNLASFYKWAVRNELVAVDPTATIERPRLRRLLPRPISDGDLRMAVDAADPRMRCWLLLAALEGLRCKEIALLAREDVLDAHSPPMLVVRDGKGGHQRTVPLHPDVAAALHSYGMPRSGPLWRGRAGDSLRPETVSKYVSGYLHGIGIAASAHQGRHWFGTKTYAESHDLREVQELLGHASVTTTAGYVAYNQHQAVATVLALDLRAGGPTSCFGPEEARESCAGVVDPTTGRR